MERYWHYIYHYVEPNYTCANYITFETCSHKMSDKRQGDWRRYGFRTFQKSKENKEFFKETMGFWTQNKVATLTCYIYLKALNLSNMNQVITWNEILRLVSHFVGTGLIFVTSIWSENSVQTKFVGHLKIFRMGNISKFCNNSQVNNTAMMLDPDKNFPPKVWSGV